jgi:hypothetical protein
MTKTRSTALDNQGVLGSFAHIDTLEQAIDAARSHGFEVRDVFSPVPVSGVLAKLAPQPSPVRFATFLGGLAGLIGGLALGILTSLIWNIVVAGKPVANHVPFMVLGFEAMILLGAFGTLFGLIIAARLPFTKFPGPAYREEFSKDRFGLWLGCKDDELQKALALLQNVGAESFNPVGSPTRGNEQRSTGR